jgi:hypothetical protein
MADFEKDRYRSISPKLGQDVVWIGVAKSQEKNLSRALFRALISAGFAGKTRRREIQPIPVVAASAPDTILPDRVSTETPAFLAA